ncbi:MAG: hypothetical protein ACHQQS_14535 [Thermoanaerobaculales bacterium]
MSVHRAALAVITLCLSAFALAQPASPPLVNWAAPPYWAPPAGHHVAHAQTSPALASFPDRGVSVASTPETPLTGTLPFVAVTPCRLVDTRHGPKDVQQPGGSTPGFPRVQFASGEIRSYDLTSSTDCTSLPAGVGGWSLQFQFTTGGGSGVPSYLEAWPYNSGLGVGFQSAPAAESTMLGYADRWTANSAVIPAGSDADGSINVYVQNAGDVIIEVNGYYGEANLSTTPNPMQIAMLIWYHAANIPAHFTAGGDIHAPVALAFDGAHIWVANGAIPGSVTELNASDGSKVGTFTGSGDINGPFALAFDGAHIWVANDNGKSVTELNASDGTKVGTFTAGTDINAPDALALDGAHIWVANYSGNSVTELKASDGSKVGTFTAGTDINTPDALAFDGAHIWVANYGISTVTELNASDGSKVGTFTAGGDITNPTGLAFDGAHIWVANFFGNSVTELNASNGSKVGTFTAGGDINGPGGLAFDGALIWVANFLGNSVTELNASTGSKVDTFTAGGDLNHPQVLAFDGAHIWVANYTGNSLDKL